MTVLLDMNVNVVNPRRILRDVRGGGVISYAPADEDWLTGTRVNKGHFPRFLYVILRGVE
jgi:hypothetical protein